MMRIAPAARPIVRALVLAALALSAVLAPTPLRVAAQTRAHDATLTTVAYHLSVMYVDGAMRGRTIEAGVMGMLDSSGTLTATLLATSGATSTVMGSLTSTLLMVRGKAATLTLGGKALKRGGLYGGVVALSDGTPAGAWLLTPELSSTSLALAATITSGRRQGDGISGTLALTSDAAGHFDGSMVLDDGSTVVATGRMSHGNLQIALYLPDGGVLLGTAPLGHTIVNNAIHTSYKGSFAGPGTGDHGIWTAIVSD